MTTQASEIEEPSEGSKRNAIVTYNTVEAINKNIILVSYKLDRLDEKLGEQTAKHDDHEVRLRALELVSAARQGSTGFATWAGPVLLTVVAIGISVLNYLK